MTFWITVIVLIIVSFFWAVLALRAELSKPREVKRAEDELKREKILFKV